MSKTIGEAIMLIQRLGQFDLAGINMDGNEISYHNVRHRFKEEIVIPYIGIGNNITFMTNKGERHIIFVDGTKGKVVEAYEKHICELGDKIRSLYNLSEWEFIQRWYNTYNGMDSMHFVVIKVEKEE